MDDMKLKHGVFSWNELMTTDAEGAKQFYGSLFGWEWEEFPMEQDSYWVVKAQGEGVGGVMKMPPEIQGMPPVWGAYVTVDDVHASAAKAKELGGEVVEPPREIPKVGTYCVVKDPQGAYIAMVTYFPME